MFPASSSLNLTHGVGLLFAVFGLMLTSAFGSMVLETLGMATAAHYGTLATFLGIPLFLLAMARAALLAWNASEIMAE